MDDVNMRLGPLVCLVEDYPLTEEMATSMLRFGGFDVISAAHGGVLDSLVDQGLQPDLFLMSLELPGESGFSIMRRLRANPTFAGVPIIAMTALGFRRDRREIVKSGFDGVIYKPFDMATFQGTVREFYKRGHQSPQRKAG